MPKKPEMKVYPSEEEKRFVEEFAQKNGTTVNMLMRQLIVSLSAGTLPAPTVKKAGRKPKKDSKAPIHYEESTDRQGRREQLLIVGTKIIGYDPYPTEIIEIGIINVKGEALYHSIFNPENEDALAICQNHTGKSKDEILSAPTLKEQRDIIRGILQCADNVLVYDLEREKPLFERQIGISPSTQIIAVHKGYEKQYPEDAYDGNLKKPLSGVASALGVRYSSADAVAVAKTIFSCFKVLRSREMNKGVTINEGH